MTQISRFALATPWLIRVRAIAKLRLARRWRDISIELVREADISFGAFEVPLAIIVRNTGFGSIDDCLVQLEGHRIPSAPDPFVLRSSEQIDTHGKGRFRVPVGQPKTIPVLYRNAHRPGELFLLDENQRPYLFPGYAARFKVAVYGLSKPSTRHVQISLGSDWQVTSRLSS